MKTSPHTALIKRLARELRYLPLSEFVGRNVRIRSIQTVADDVRDVLSLIVPEECQLLTDAKLIEGTLAKYGFLDLTFSAPSCLLESQYQSGISLLKDLRYIREPSEVEEEDYDFYELLGEDPTFLTQLTEDLATNKVFIRLFLRGAPAYEDVRESLRGIPALPPQYLPRLFAIADVCVTNAESVWFHKHFYM